MQRLNCQRELARVGVMIAGLVMSASWAAAAVQTASKQEPAAGSAQAGTPVVPAAQTAAAQAYEYVQVPVTYAQTLYRTECRTENVPVTRMVREVVNETRHGHVLHAAAADGDQAGDADRVRADDRGAEVLAPCAGHQDGAADDLSDILHDRDGQQGHHSHGSRVRDRDGAGDQDAQGRRAPSLLRDAAHSVDLVRSGCHLRHTCGHRCGGGGCGACGGATVCVQYRPVTTCTYQQVPVMRARGEIRAGNLLRAADSDEVQSRAADGHGTGD